MIRCMRVALVAMLLTIGVLAPAAARGIVTSSFVYQFASLFNPGGDNEPVMLNGGVHIVTQVSPGTPCAPTVPCNIYINLADMHGVGRFSGRRYVAVGADMLTLTDPIPGNPVRAEFVIMPVSQPTDPIIPGNPLMPIVFEVVLGFDAGGHLDPGLINVTVPGGAGCGDACPIP